MDIGNMPAGRKLDALVAEKVMGWKPSEKMEKGCILWLDENGINTGYYKQVFDDRNSLVFKPSENIAAAWEVVKHFKTERKAAFGIEGRWDNLWVVRFFIPLANNDPRRDGITENWRYDGEAPNNICLAICRAALKAVGMEK